MIHFSPRIFFLATLYLAVPYSLLAKEPLFQQSKKKEPEKEKPVEHTLDMGLGYSSNNAISGKNSSKIFRNLKKALFVNTDIKQPIFFYNLLYTAPFGLVVSGCTNIIGNSDSTQTQSTTTFDMSLGYNLSLLNDKLTIYPSYTRFFYQDYSTSITSLFKNQFALDLSYDFKYTFLSVGGTLMKGTSTDYGINSQLYFPITIDKFITDKAQLSICPGIDAIWGNQSYNSDLIVQNLLDGVTAVKRKNTGWDPTIAQIAKFPRLSKKLTNLNKLVFGNEPLDGNEKFSDYIARIDNATQPKFKLTTVGISLPLIYTNGNYSMNVTFSYQKALNTANPNAKLFRRASGLSESTNSFLFSAGINYVFGW